MKAEKRAGGQSAGGTSACPWTAFCLNGMRFVRAAGLDWVCSRTCFWSDVAIVLGM